MPVILFSYYLLALSNLLLIPTAKSYSVILWTSSFIIPSCHMSQSAILVLVVPQSPAPYNPPSLVLLIFGKNGKWRTRSSMIMSVECTCVTLITSKLTARIRRLGMFPPLASWIKFAGTPMEAPLDGYVSTADYRTYTRSK
jgi:hypothetical protein